MAVQLDDQGEAVAACIALEALCRANDGNKKAAARIKGEFNDEEIVNKPDDLSVPLFKSDAGALDALMTILETTADPKLKVRRFRGRVGCFGKCSRWVLNAVACLERSLQCFG